MQPPLYPETLRQGLEAEAGRDDADRADDRGLVRQDLVGRTGQPVAAGRGDILAERDHRHVVFDRKRTDTRRDESRLRSEEHTSELQSLMRTSYAVFCLKQ